MTIELTKLALTVVLGVVQIVLSAHKYHQHGYWWLPGRAMSQDRA